ncbi:efflux RND transporter permease subunit [Myxococcota bacterium]|nr:efflux RND transporter permease subunit [Myxococcota bacterium]
MSRPRMVIGLVSTACLVAVLVLLERNSAGLDTGFPLRFSLDLDPSSTPLRPSGDPATDIYHHAIRNFGDDEIFLIVMRAPDIFTTKNLKAMRRISRATLNLPAVQSTESLVAVTVIRNDPIRDQLEVRPLLHEIPESPEALESLRAQALADPLLVERLISRDSQTAALQVRFRRDSDLERIRKDVDGQIRRIIESESTDQRSFHIAGRPHMKATAHSLMVTDLQILLPLAMGVMALVLWFFSGSVRGVLMPLGTVSIATLLTFAAMAALETHLNLLTVVLGPILIAVGGVYGVHILAHYELAADDAGSSREASIRLQNATRAPVLMAGTSTAVGFGALLLTDIPAAQQLGGFASLGVVVVTLLSLTLLPACVALLPLRNHSDSPRARILGAHLDGLLTGLARFTIRHSGGVIVAWAMACVVALAALPHIRVDTDYLSFFPEDSRLRRDFAAIDDHLSGAIPIYVTFENKDRGSFNDPARLRVLESIQHRIDAVPGVSQTTSIVDLVRSVNRAIHQGDPRSERIPDSEGEVAEVLLVIPKAKARPLINVDQRRANLWVRTGVQGSARVKELVRHLEAAVSAEIPQSLEAHVTSDTVLINRSADGLASNQARTVGITALMVFLVVCTTFRSLPLALVALIPNVVPVLLFYGLLGLGIAPLSLPTSLIGSIVLGIAVDDTVHFLARYRLARRRGQSADEAVIDCGRRVGRPIAITSIMLFLGFLLITQSGFAKLQEFGGLIGLTICICLATDLLLLPAVLSRARVRT